MNIEELVSEASSSLKETHDDKAWCRTDEIIALLKAGAVPIEINQKQIGRSYSHMVSYKDIIFVNVTEAPSQELEEYSVK